MKHIVGFSGGIDSQACARWVLNRFPAEDVILTNSDAGGNEDPLTTEFIAWYSANVHPVTACNAQVKDIWVTDGFAETKGLDGDSPLTFERLIEIKGAPSSQKQFCTHFLKLVPQRNWLNTTFGPGGPFSGEAYCRYAGVRRDESPKRRNTPFQKWDDWFDCDVFAPIADWTKQMCFDYVQAHGERVNPLYAMGFNRVGCAPCINSRKDDIANWAARRPSMIDKLREMERRTGVAFFHTTDRGGTAGIDEVVAWSQTARGGRARLLPMMVEREGCESKYGLCE